MNNKRIIVLVKCLLVLGVLTATVDAQRVTSGVLGKSRSWATPYYFVESNEPGPTVIVTGGIHGNEPAGALAAEQIRHWPIVRGKLIVIPRVNVAALSKKQRLIPERPRELADLNRNFPGRGQAAEPRGEIAKAIWNFVNKQNPDWLFDLHEGFEFNISHQPKSGQSKSVGSTIIYDNNQGLGPIVKRMLAAANATVTDKRKKFVPLSRGPVRTSLARAVIDSLGKKALILETTFKDQRIPVRTRQHRVMINAALMEIGMINQDCTNILTPSNRRDGRILVALFNDTGATERGVNNLSRALGSATDIVVTQIDADDIRSNVLSQFDVVVCGGGSGSREAATLGKNGAAAVQKFVNQGGGYVGICAGAYLGSAHYGWSLNLIDTAVLTGKREVEGVGPRSMWYRGKSSDQKIQLTPEGKKTFPGIDENLVVRYQNGPIVSPRNSAGLGPYKVLAWFRSEKVLHPPQKGTMVNTPAIVSGKFGAGRVMTISPHPEATPGLEKMIPMAVRAVAPARTTPQENPSGIRR